MRLLLVFSAFVAGLAPASVAARAPEIAGARAGRWAHEVPRSLAPDERVVWGRLDNGFRYALLPHRGVPGRVTLQLLVLSGSLDERPNELGMAHYLEHLAFGGSNQFNAEQMVALFQRLGVEYGSDVNAVTTFDYTAYRLDFRENDLALLREGIRLFRGIGDGLTFDPRILEQERRVVRAELRNRRTLSDQRQAASLPVIFRGLQFPHRSPGGDETQIARFTREQFQAFYRRCYRPDLMVLVGAGDFDAAQMAEAARDLFGDMARPTEPIPPRDEGRLDAKNMRAGLFRINGMGSVAAQVASVVALPAKADSREARVEQQQRRFVMDVFADRLRTQLETGAGAEAEYSEVLGFGAARASVAAAAPMWDEALVELDTMVRRTIERGFDENEIEPLRQRSMRMTALMLDQLPTIDPATLCESLLDSITTHTVFEGYERRFAWMRDWLQSFNPRAAQQIFRTLWQPQSMAYQLAGGIDLDLEPKKILDAVQKSRRGGLAQLMTQQRRELPFKLPKWGAPTPLVERQEIPELGAKLMRFGNNVRFNFISNRQEPGLTRVVVRVGGGLLTMPGDKPALKEFGLNTLLASGAPHVRPDQLESLMEHRFLEFSFDIDDRDAFTFRGTLATENLEVFLGVVTDFLHAPLFNSYVHRDEKMRAAMGRMMSAGGMGEGMRELTDHLFKGDARFTWGKPLDYLGMSVVDVRRWMQEPLERGYVEVTIAGDVTEEAAVNAMTRTLGSLAKRAEKKEAAEAPKPVQVTAPAGFKRIEFVGEQNIGLVVGTWPADNVHHVRDQAALEVLAKVLELRVRSELREKLGLAYGPSAEYDAHDGFPGFGLLRAVIDCAPNDTGRVAPLVSTIGGEVAEKGVTEGEFIGARGILKSQLRRAFRENSFLVNVLMRAQERPEETQEIVALHGDLLDTITRDEVNKWAAQVLPTTNCRSAAVVPKAFVGILDAGN